MQFRIAKHNASGVSQNGTRSSFKPAAISSASGPKSAQRFLDKSDAQTNG
jgi:hypothetical protein